MRYDFSATPYIPTGKGISEETLYGRIVSDFSLNDTSLFCITILATTHTDAVAVNQYSTFQSDYVKLAYVIISSHSFLI